MARGDGSAVVGYDPANRSDGMHVEYMVHKTGARWFIPGSSASGVSDLTQCDKIAGDTDDGTPAASETVA